MYRHFGNDSGRSGQIEPAGGRMPAIHSGRSGPLLALEPFATRFEITRNREIYAEGDSANCWYKVVSGAVRISKLLADGRRYIAEFCLPGDCFGFDSAPLRPFSAEAVTDSVVVRLPRAAGERLIDQNPALGREWRESILRELAQAHGRMLLLGRMTASERVAAFLLEMCERCEQPDRLDLPMSRNDIADYLGLTTETVCRVLSGFRREGVIAAPDPHRIFLLDRATLETAADR